MNLYRVKCKNCKRTEDIAIDEQRNIHWGDVKNIISGRYRLDMQWGWECGGCGNNDLVSDQEKAEIKNLQAPDPNDISKVLKAIKTQEPRFEMTVLD